MAEELVVQVIEAKNRVLGEEHPHTLTSIDNVALIYRGQGRWKEAISLTKKCTQLRTKVLGSGHPTKQESLEAFDEWEDRIQ